MYLFVYLFIIAIIIICWNKRKLRTRNQTLSIFV